MKRSEIKLGAELFHQASKHDEPAKATVVDAGWWRYLRDKPVAAEPGTYGCGVLVDLTRRRKSWEPKEPAEVTQRTVAIPRDLRGPWEQLKAEYDAVRKAKRDAAHADQVDADAKETTAAGAIGRAAVLGVSARYERYSSKRKVEIEPAVFAAMVDALAASGWRYESSAAVQAAEKEQQK